MKRKREIKEIIDRMSLSEKVGQLFMLAFPGKDPELIKPLIEKYGITGCYISQDNAETFAEASYLSYKIQTYGENNLTTKIPMLLGVDQEGAWGILVSESHTGPGNLALGALDDPEMTSKIYRIFAEEMLSVGFNALLAPCADVNSVYGSPIIGTRSFGEDPVDVGRNVKKAVQGGKKGQILTTLKHFPGHGATESDSHRDIPRVNKSIEELLGSDLVPFREGIEAGADIVMTSHIKYPKLDPDRPATMSPAILQDLLREKLQFSGVILSDSMNMGAIRNHYDPAESTLEALKAGVDMIMLSEEHYDHSQDYIEKQIDSLKLVKNAVKEGELPLETLESKLERILDLKFNKMNIRSKPLNHSEKINHFETQQKAAREAIHLFTDKNNNWPIDLDKSIVCVNTTPEEAYSKITNPRGIGPNQEKSAYDYFEKKLKELAPGVKFLDSENITNSEEDLNSGDVILAITEDYPLPGEDFPKQKQQENLERLFQNYPEKLVIVGLRSPYEHKDYPEEVTYISTYSSRPCSAVEMARLVYEGKELPKQDVSF